MFEVGCCLLVGGYVFVVFGVLIKALVDWKWCRQCCVILLVRIKDHWLCMVFNVLAVLVGHVVVV
jgi:hypothetical protein